LALAAQKSGAHVLIFAPDNAPAVKVQAMQARGAQVHLVPGGYTAAEAAGLAYAAEHETTWVSPYNDGMVIAGQGTLALEALRQVKEIVEGRASENREPLEATGNQGFTWLVPVGGGGLLSGVAAAVKLRPTGYPGGTVEAHRVVGVQAAASPFFHALYHTGSQEGVDDLPSLADGLTGAVEVGSMTIPLVKKLADDLILVSETEIEAAIAYAWERHGQAIEGSGAVGLAAVLAGKTQARPALAVVSGGNIQPEIHTEIVHEHHAR
jgi:threonine dehydratase